METMKQKLIASLIYRCETEIVPQNPVKFLLIPEINYEDIINLSIQILYLYTRRGKGNNKQIVLMSEVICAIGHLIRKKYKLKRDSAIAAKAGAFILYTFELFGILKVELGRSTNGHAAYLINILDDNKLCRLWETLKIGSTEKLPVIAPYADWISTKHETGLLLVKTSNRDVLNKITPQTHPLIFNCVNKAQHVGWMINEPIYEIYLWALRNKTDAFKDIWDIRNLESRTSKLRETTAVGDIAGRYLGQVFYH